MKLKFVLFTLSLAATLPVLSQSVEEIRESSDYISGEGFGRSLREADNDALKSLISKISISVHSDFSSVEEEVVTSDGVDANSAVRSVIQTYSQATLQNTERIIVKQEPNAEVFRYVKRSDVNKIFESRKNKVLDMMASAQKAESKGKIDDALRYYYWGYCLLQSLPNANAVTNEAGNVLVHWIPDQIDDILDDIRFVKENVDDIFVELKVLYKGEPVTSLDYTYFDGMNWSNIYSARDGRGILEMRPGASTDNLQVKCEYEYFGESHIDKEIAQVVEVMRGRVFRGATCRVFNELPQDLAVNTDKASETAVIEQKVMVEIETDADAGQNALLASAAGVKPKATLTLLTADEAKPYAETMDKVMAAIRTGKYDTVKDQFSEDGIDMFNKLVSYGKGRIVGTPDPTYMAIGDEVVCRSIPINFSFNNNNRQFVENITFTFNADKKIDCLAFGLDEKAADDILHHVAWGEYARKILTEFLENYKTAYSLKRLDYLRQVFDDNAVIITGKVVTRPEGGDDSGRRYLNNKYVQLTRQSKEQYLRNLERCFESNEFINIRFAENDIVKAGVGGEVYGIQIKQDYYSSNYGDTGYLFLMVDLNDPKQPIIKVRVWQPERDPDFKGLPNF